MLVKPEEKANDDDIKISRNMTREEGGDVGGYEGGRRGCEVSARRNKQQQGEQAPSPTPSSSKVLISKKWGKSPEKNKTKKS